MTRRAATHFVVVALKIWPLPEVAGRGDERGLAWPVKRPIWILAPITG